MEQQTTQHNKWKKPIRILLKTLLWIFLLILVLFLLLLTPPVQQFITKKATHYLQEKLDTRVSIGRLFVTLGGRIALDDVYIEDRQQDTLLSAGALRVRMSWSDLIFNGAVDIESIQLSNATVKLNRQLPDTSFNFQFIIDVFGSTDTTTSPPSSGSSSTDLRIGTISLQQIRLVYKDVLTGNDIEAQLGQLNTRIRQLDLDEMSFALQETRIAGLNATVIQKAPLPVTIAASTKLPEAADTSATSLSLDPGLFVLSQSQIDYRDSTGAMYAYVNAGELKWQPGLLIPDKGIYNLGSLQLADTRAAVRMGKSGSGSSPVVDTARPGTSESTGMRLLLTALDLSNVELKYDDEAQPATPRAFDYAHINTRINKLQLSNFAMAGDSMKGKVQAAVLRDQSGFGLEALQGNFLYTSRRAQFTDFYVRTVQGTELQRDLRLSYPSLEALSNDVSSLDLNLDISKSKLKLADILFFAPTLREQPAFSQPSDTWYVDGKITGKVSDLMISQLEFKGLSATTARLHGRIIGLPDADAIQADMVIEELSSTATDISRLAPPHTIPASISLPERMQLNGVLKGGVKQLTTKLALQTSAGDVLLEGTAASLTDARAASYDLNIQTRSVQLGHILRDTSLYGPLTANMVLNGKGYDPEYGQATLDGSIQSVKLKGYTYHDLKLKGSLERQQAMLNAGIQDPNIHLSSTISVDLAAATPALKGSIVIDSIKLQQLHLAQDPYIFRGRINADFDRLDPDSLKGQLLLTQALLVKDQDRIKMDTVLLDAGDLPNAGQYLHLRSDIAQLQLEGRYRLTALPDIFMQAINPYYNMGVVKADSSDYDFTLNATATDRPLLRALVPGLEKMEGLQLQSRFSHAAGIEATLLAQELVMQGNRVSGLQLTANTADSALKINMAARQLASGSSLEMDSTLIQASVSGNKIDFGLLVKDKAAKDRYAMNGTLQQHENGEMQFALKPQGLLLNYEKWDVSQANGITITSAGDILANDFTLSQGAEQLSLQSLSKASNAPLHVRFTDFRLSTITAMVMADSALVDGRLTGEIDLRDLQTKPAFTGDLKINDLSYHADTIGNVTAKFSNSGGSDVYAAAIQLNGYGNEATINGTYNAGSSLLDLKLDLTKLPLKTAEAFAGGSIRNAQGYVSGPFRITGNITEPSIVGNLGFHGAGFNVSMLNSYFRVDDEQLQFTKEGISFNQFEVKDSAGNRLTLNGSMATRNYTNYKFDLDIRANNFRALNSTKADNDLFWGQLYFNTNLKVKGTEQSPVIDGRLAINDKTKMTIVLPQSDPGVVDRNGVIEFVDMDAPVDDSLFMRAYDSLNTSALTGMDVSLNVEVDKGADFTLIIDAGNGDFLNVKGEAQLTTGIDPSGKITMVGTYELDQGAYELSFNMIRKKFDIQRGSKIIWEGEPTSASVNIAARYIANTAPLDLVKGQLDENISAQERNTYLQRLPFEVMLKMTGELMKPQIAFDILLPENKSYGVSNDILTNVRTKLEQLRQSTGDMNKQVFSLLLLNRFVAENPFSSLASQNSASTLLRQSVSKLLTEQLNRLADGLIQGVDINLGLDASDDYTTGERQEKTDLNVGLSKRLLNDRLTVTVGSNFALEGPQNSNQQSNNIAGNVAIDYALSSDGRYKLRAYRKNDYQGVIDGYVVETGLSFIITVDYNQFKQIFQSRRKQEELRNQRRNRQDTTNSQPKP